MHGLKYQMMKPGIWLVWLFDHFRVAVCRYVPKLSVYVLIDDALLAFEKPFDHKNDSNKLFSIESRCFNLILQTANISVHISQTMSFQTDKTEQTTHDSCKISVRVLLMAFQ